MKRYRMRATLKGEYEVPNAESFPHEDGAWVLWSDHRKHSREMHRLTKRSERLNLCMKLVDMAAGLFPPFDSDELWAAHNTLRRAVIAEESRTDNELLALAGEESDGR